MVDSRIKIWAERTAESCGHVPMLVPFWGENPKLEEGPLKGRFNEYCAVASSLFELVPIETAKLAVLPFDYGHVLNGTVRESDATSYVQRARAAGLKTLVFCWHDDETRVALEDVIVMRTSLRRSTRLAVEHCMPPWPEDLVQRYCGGSLCVRRKAKVLRRFRRRM